MANDLPILTPSECAALSAIEAKMTPGGWRVASDLPALAITSSNGFHVVQTENQNNYRHFGHSEHWHGIPNEKDARGIVELRNAAPRMLATIAAYEAELKWRCKDAEDWKFVGDDFGGHMLSVPTGDKWYPESFMRKEIAAHEATIAGLRKQLEGRV